ncbi:mucin-2-like [Ixodes scapularis]
MDAFQHVVGDAGLLYLQHHGGARFMAAVNSMATAQRLVAQGHLLLGDVQVPLEPVGAHVVHVSVYRLPPYVFEDALVQVLGQYGKVKGLSHVTYRDRPDIRTGTRVVKLEMAKPVPNFIHIQGHRVMVDYRGMRRVCSRCGQEGHFGPACKTPRCDRCGVFGHPTEGCAAPCQRCGHAHATTDCVQRKTYSAAARDPRRGSPPPASTPEPLTTQAPGPPEQAKPPSATTRLPTAPGVSSPAAEPSTTDVLPAHAETSAPRFLQAGDARKDLSIAEGATPSLLITCPNTAEIVDVTPGQGNPPPSPTLPSASASPSTLVPLPDSDAPLDPRSDDDDAMCCDRPETKRGLTSTSSGSDVPGSSTKKKRLGSEKPSDLEDFSDSLVF